MTSTALDLDPVYNAGDFQEGDRVRVTTDVFRHMGAFGTVTKVDREPDERGPIPFPVVVWLDVFGVPSAAERAGKVGSPVHAGEIEKVNA
jgi:transcription antitermination factor NusG